MKTSQLWDFHSVAGQCDRKVSWFAENLEVGGLFPLSTASHPQA